MVAGPAGAASGVPPTPAAAAQGTAKRSLSAARRPREPLIWGSAGLGIWAAPARPCAATARGSPGEGCPPPPRPQHPGPLTALDSGGRGRYVPEEAAVADDTTTPLAHRVRQRIRAEKQLSGAQWRQRTQPVSPVGGAELFHLRRLHPRRAPAPQASAAFRSWRLAGCREPGACALRSRTPRGGAGATEPLSMPRWSLEVGPAGWGEGVAGLPTCSPNLSDPRRFREERRCFSPPTFY